MPGRKSGTIRLLWELGKIDQKLDEIIRKLNK